MPLPIRIFRIVSPVANRAALIVNGTMRVAVVPSRPDMANVVGRVIGINEAEPADPVYDANTGGFYRLTESGFEKPDFPVTDIPANAPSAANKKFIYWAFDAQHELREMGSTVFWAQAPTVTVRVFARHCIWLTYRNEDNLELPTHKENAANRPATVRIPEEATRIAIAYSADRWTHGPNHGNAPVFTGAEGEANTAQGLHADHAAQYRGDDASGWGNIVENPMLVLNRLVAIWQYATPATSTPEMDLIAVPNLMIPSTPRPLALRLGMHDGFEWTNNSGYIDVTVTFT